jgi:hypothetical protein
MRRAGHLACMEGNKNVSKISVGKPRRRWEDSIK